MKNLNILLNNSVVMPYHSKSHFILSSFLSCMFFFTCTSSNAQSNEKSKLISDNIAASGIIVQTKQMANIAIDAYAKKYPSVPNNTWLKIKSQINYSLYEREIFDIYNKDLDETGLKKLLIQYKNSNNRNAILLPEKLKKDLYNAGNKFGQSLSNLIKSNLNK